MKKFIIILLFTVCILISTNIFAYPASLKEYIVDSVVTKDGRVAIALIVPGKPPENYRAPVAYPTRSSVILSQVPAFDWSFGCSATSAAMVAGHYDNMGYPNMYTGPANSGVVPMNNSVWGSGECPLSATRNGVDGRTIKGHVDDYWISYGAQGPDPWDGHWTEHTYGECTADYMKTNQWIIPADTINIDGGTVFLFWNDGSPMTDANILAHGWDNTDGAYGFKLFCESRGYTVNDLYSQATVEQGLTYGFSYNDFKDEIDAGHPVLIQVTGHTMVGYGYDDGGGTNTIYIHDTWDYSDHTMTWAGWYSGGYHHYAVTVLELALSTINVWTGNLNNYWGNGSNWSLGHIPTAAEDVEIPNINMPCIVDYSDTVCRDLLIYPDATVNIYDQTLTVNNDLTVHGTIEMTQADAYLNVMHDIVWESGSSLDVLNNSTFIQVWGDWNFESGANVNPTQGFVDFEGTASTYIRCYDADCSFYNLRFYRTVGLSGLSTQDLVINGVTFINSAGAFNNLSDENIWLRGYFNYYGPFDLTGSGSSTVYFDGASQGIHKYSTNDGVFNNVTFSSSTGTTITGGGLTAEGNIVINQGFFNPGTDPVSVGGNWTNYMGASGFVEGTGSVVFNGSNSAAIITPETFYDLHVDKTYVGFAGLQTGFGNDNGVDVIVTNNLVIYDGTMELNNPTNLVIGNQVSIYSGASINANDSGTINISLVGDWFDYNSSGGFDAGSASIVTFYGASPGDIHEVGENSYFNDIVINSNASYVRPSSIGAVIYCKNMDIVQGKLKIATYRIVVDEAMTIAGTLEMSSAYDSLFVGDITWEAGSSELVADGLINVTGNWTNLSGLLTLGTSMVIFDSNGDHQTVNGNNTFYNVQQVNTGYYLRFYGNTTIHDLELNYFSWAYGNINVNGTLNIDNPSSKFTANAASAIATIATLDQGGTLYCNGGTITVNDLLESGIYGTHRVNGGTVDIYQDGSSYVDLNGDMIIEDGEMNIHGGNGASWWPFAADATITMYNGVLDFKDVGINIYDNGTYSLTKNITGGTIRTTGYFTGNRTDFNPAAGTVELYGTAFDANLSMGVGSNFYNVLINKSVTDNVITKNMKSSKREKVSVDRDGTPIELTRSNTAFASSNLDINGNLQIDSGTFDLNGNTVDANNVNVNNGGTLIVDEGAILQLNDADELAVNNGGTLEVLGTSGNLATVTHHTSGNYAFNVYSGGTISAEYGMFEHMTENGVYVWEGGIVDPTHSFDYCTFRNGYVGPGTLLYINNYDNITITGGNFPDASSTQYNVAKVIEPPAGQGYITMVGFTGIFAGEDDDYDPFNRINWGGLPAIDDLTIQYNAGNIELIWTYPVPVDQFKVYRSTDPYDFSGADVFTTYIVGYSEPATGTKYFYRVTAEDITDNVGSGGKTTSSGSAP